MTFKLLTLDMSPIWGGLTDPKVIEKQMANPINKDKPNPDQTPNFPTGTEEFKDSNSRYNLSKFEYDLYHEEDDKTEKMIRVKWFSMPNKGDKWKIFEDTKVMFVIEGTKLTKKEKEFLRTVDGVNFLIAQYKAGIKSFNSLRNKIKEKLDGSKADGQ